MIEPWVLTVATKGGEYLFKTFSSKMGDTIEKKFELQLKGAIKEAIVEFIELFVQELRDSGITENIDPDYRSFLQPFIQPFIKDKDTPSTLDYKSLIQSFIKDEDALLILGEAFDAGFKGFDRNAQTKIEEIWSKHLLKSRLTFPANFKWQSLLKAYQEKVTKIRQDNPKLRDIFNSQKLGEMAGTSEEIKDILKANASIPIGFDLDGYRKSLQESYGDLKLGRLGKKDEHNIQLGKIFIEQNVREALPPDRSPDPNSDDSERNRRQYLEKSVEPVLKVLRDENCQRAVLLGDPGAGKSSLLQYLALDWVEDNTKPFPLLIELREYAIDRADAKNFLDFLSKGGMARWGFDRHELHQYLQTQPSLVMFDGLDEIFDPQLRQSIIEEIANFATQEYPNVKIVITSRVVGYVPDRLRSVDFQHFTLQELDKSQIQDFIDTWYRLAQGEKPKQEQLKQRLKEAIDRFPAIQNLANNPLLLTLMAMLNQEGDLPTRRVDLYDRASRLLLHNWDFDVNGKNLADPALKQIDAPEKQKILGKIAYTMQSDPAGLAGNLLDGESLQQILTVHLKEWSMTPAVMAKQLIEQLRTRSFILCAYGTDAYGFVHRTFLEYFCAKGFVRRLKEELYSLEQLRDDVFVKHWQNETWHEVLQLICGLLKPEEAGYLVEFLMNREVDRSDYLHWTERAEIGAFQHLQLATECWAEVKSPKPRLTAQKLKEKLKEEIESQSKISLSYGAAQLLLDSIAEYYHQEPETLTWLKDIAFNDQNEYVRRAAVMSIGQNYHQEPETLTWLKDIALNAQDELVRRAAVRSIAEYYHQEPETLTWLKDIALNDQNKWVRRAAVRSIAEYYHQELETLTWLQDIALNDQNELVRGVTVWSIAQYYIQTDEAFELLCQIASQDPYRGEHDDNLRKIALEAVVENYIDRPEVIELLRDRSTQDPDEELRIWAEEQLKNIA